MGPIQLASPISRWIYLSLALGLAAAVLGFLVFGHYTRRSHVTGQLVPTAGLLGVRSTMTGTVTRVYVHEGQHVRRGQPLLDLTGDTDSTTMGDVHARISASLRAQQTELASDLSTQRQSSREREHALARQLLLLRQQSREVRSQYALQARQFASDGDLLHRIEPLSDKGYVSAFQVQQLSSRVLQDQTQEKTLQRQLISIRQQVNDTRQKLAQAPLDLKNQTVAIQRQLDDIRQQLAQNEADRAVVLRAPRSGIVTTMLATVGQAVNPGESLLSILPRGSRLQAQLLVPSRAVGFIAPGSTVVLRYQAYPYQKFGQQYGHISDISRSALSPSEILALTGLRANQPLYRVQVRLDSQRILAYGKPQALRPGMALNADILMDRRSLLEWVFDPLYGLGRDALATRRPHA